MGIANLAINGSFLPYVYLVLLQVSIVYLQRPDQNRRLRRDDSAIPEFYSIALGLVGSGLNWLSWLFSAYVAKEFGILSGVLFFVLGMATSMIANFLIPRVQRVDQIGHIISIPATLLLVRAILLETGIQTGF
jgi:apolipoprotein N-acyltransferase